jgi:cytochrome c oxidase cbb3-type subunit 2
MASNDKPIPTFSHEKIETNNFLMIVLILLVVAVGGIVEIVPLFFQRSTTQPVPGLKPYTALQLAGRDVYQREGCYNCHSQMIRPFRAETLRYGHYSTAGEFVYDHPFQWGSKRTGPDLHRVGGKYSDDWHRLHLINPRDLVPESNMPAYPWLERQPVDAAALPSHMTALRPQVNRGSFNMDVNALRIVVTLLSFACFAGIVVWAWSSSNRSRFEEAAHIPFNDGDPS